MSVGLRHRCTHLFKNRLAAGLDAGRYRVLASAVRRSWVVGVGLSFDECSCHELCLTMTRVDSQYDFPVSTKNKQKKAHDITNRKKTIGVQASSVFQENLDTLISIITLVRMVV